MKDLIIRDDDLSYWTDIKDIEDIYCPLFEKGIKVTFGVIPYAVKSYHLGEISMFYQDYDQVKCISENKPVVNFIQLYGGQSTIEAALHGFEHKYTFSVVGNTNVQYPATAEYLSKYRIEDNIIFIGEFNNKTLTEPDYSRMVKNGIDLFSGLFEELPLTSFIPPSNQFCVEALNAVKHNRLDISGIYSANRYDLVQSVIRVALPFCFRIPYPYVVKTLTRELNYHSLTAVSNFSDLVMKLRRSAKLNAPFQLATHYWELNGSIRNQLYELVEYAQKLGYHSKLLRESLHRSEYA